MKLIDGWFVTLFVNKYTNTTFNYEQSVLHQYNFDIQYHPAE